jgi:hypothetical protein
MIKALICVFLVLGGLGVVIWASDQITLQGERTIYTVDCEQGEWDGLRCKGRLVAGDMHRFRVSRSRNEVVFWIAGSNAPSGKYGDCQVVDRDNWVCKIGPAEHPAIVRELSYGRPTAAGSESSVPFHAVAKWKWWALHAGLPGFGSADFGGGPHVPPPKNGRPAKVPR